MMKISPIFIILSVLSVLSSCHTKEPVSAKINCQQSCEMNAPKIVFAETEYDFGTIPGGAKQTCIFEFINDGGKDLVIENIHASCGCTTTSMVNTTIEPGRASEIEVTFQAPSYAGQSKKQIIVYTNDPENPEVSLWIAAETTTSSTTTSQQPALTPESKQPPKETMSPQLKQSLRNLNRATGG